MTEPKEPQEAREFWVSPDRVITTEVHYEIEGAIETDCFCASDDPLDSDAIHVIEFEAYRKAVEALKDISKHKSAYSGESSPDANLARATLKELGYD